MILFVGNWRIWSLIYVNVMTDEQFKRQLEFITRNFNQLTYAQRGMKKGFITAEINKILAEWEAEIANFGLMPLEKDNFS